MAEKDALHAGKKPRDTAQTAAGVTMRDICNKYLNHKQKLLDAGDLSPRTWINYRQTAVLFVAHFGRNRWATDLDADDFASLQAEMSKRWGPVQVRNYIQQTRSMFKHAYDAELLAAPIRFGPGFTRPTKKTLRLERAKKGPRMFEAAEVRALAAPGVRLLAAYAPRVAAVVAQVRVDRKTNEHKAALELLGVLPVRGAVVTGDAMFCQRDVCAAVARGGGEYLFAVKDNQPTLHFDIACMFAESSAFPPYQQARWAGERDTTTTTDKGHGRVEPRTLTTTAALSKYLADWPGIAQVFQLHRTRRFPDGRTEHETAYGITSLRPLDAGAPRLLQLNRAHWSIENNLHRVRDVSFGEDASRVRSGNGPQVLAAARNALAHLLSAAKVRNFAAALRRFAVRPLEAL